MTTYAQMLEQIQSFSRQDPTQPGTQNFQAQIPTFLGNAELRIYRELDFLATRGQNNSLSFTAGSRTLSLGGITSPSNSPVYPMVVQGLAAITPAGSSVTVGMRVQFELVSLDFLDMYWPQESVTATPVVGQAKYAMRDAYTIVVAPTPAGAYTAEITGTWRPELLSSTNTVSYISLTYPDLLLAASMVEASAWMRAFSHMSDNPQLALSWETHYQQLKASAMEEEQRRKDQGPGWEPFSSAPQTGSQRT